MRTVASDCFVEKNVTSLKTVGLQLLHCGTTAI